MFVVRGSGQFDHRFNQHYDGFPHDWIASQDMDPPQQDALFERFMAMPLCDCKPFFCRRVRRKLTKSGQDGLSNACRVFRSRPFQRLINLWADDAESATSIRNELQHASFSRKLRAGKGGGGRHRNSAAVILQDFVGNLERDHEAKYGKARKREVPTTYRLKEARTLLRSARRKVTQAKRSASKCASDGCSFGNWAHGMAAVS